MFFHPIELNAFVKMCQFFSDLYEYDIIDTEITEKHRATAVLTNRELAKKWRAEIDSLSASQLPTDKVN